MWLNPKSAPPGYYHRAGATAYLIDAAGTYSPAGEPTIDPAGAHGNPGASTPTLAAAGGCILVTGATSAAEIVDPAGSYSLSSAAIDPAGPYSGSGASAPTLADPGAYVPLGGATSSASEIVYPAGAYSGAGVSASTVDPAAGAYSGPE